MGEIRIFSGCLQTTFHCGSITDACIMGEGTGLSKEFISNVENNNTSPSINTLQTISNFLSVPLPYLSLEKQQHMKVVRKTERTNSTFNNLKIEHLTSKGGLRMMIVEFPLGASMGDISLKILEMEKQWF